MAFKQNREAGSKLGSYTSMQDKGLLNKVKDKITERREVKASEKKAEVEAMKSQNEADKLGQQYPTYVHADFQHKANELHQAVDTPDELL